MTPFKALIQLGLQKGLYVKAHFSQSDDVLADPKRDALLLQFETAIAEQMDIDPARLLRGRDITAIDNAELEALVAVAMSPLSDVLDYTAVLELMNFFSRDGVTHGLSEVPLNETTAQRIQAQTEAEAFVTARLNSIIGLDNTPQGFLPPIQQPILENPADKATIAAVVAMLSGAISTARLQEDTTKRNVASLYNALFPNRAKTRATEITDPNVLTVFNNGQYNAADIFSPRFKRWLRTFSKVPREAHLRMADNRETVPFNSEFSTGEFWSQTLPGCKCGIEVIFPASIIDAPAVSDRQEQFRDIF